MILELLLTPIFALIRYLLSLIPDLSYIYNPFGYIDLTGFIDILAYGFYVFPFHLFMIFISNFVFWLGTQKVWAFIEWVYRKFGVK